MVRLRGSGVTNLVTAVIFQFLHGAIKGDMASFNKTGQFTFQFLHGAIKGTGLVQVSNWTTNFNSYMVRLRVPARLPVFRKKHISIPTWCD